MSEPTDARSGAGVLAGIRVLDFTRHMAGPYATSMLSDFGADVIKVESMPSGDPSRGTGTAFINGESALYLMWNRGKRSVQIDLRTDAGLDLAQRLSDSADIVVENYREGVADAIGIGYDELSERNPGLIYISITAYGRGPLEELPGTDPIVQAMSGVMSVTGEADGPPLLVGVPVGDMTGAMMTVQAALLGLLARQQVGAGQYIEVSLLHGLVSALSTRLAAYWATNENPTRNGSAHSLVVPYQAYETADGWAVAGVWGPTKGGWPRFCRALDRSELIEDPRFATNIDRVHHKTELNAVLVPAFRERTIAEWQERFRREGALFGPINTVRDIIEHEQLSRPGFITTVQHPTAGNVKQVGPVLNLSATPGYVRRHPPLLGEHTHEVLHELGLTDDEIDELAAKAAIRRYSDDERIHS